MKRWLFILIIFALGAKFFTTIVVKLAKSPTDISNALQLHDKGSVDFLRWANNTASKTSAPLPAAKKSISLGIPKIVNAKKMEKPKVDYLAPKVLTAEEVKKLLAANQSHISTAVKPDAQKEDTERRKKRRKKLENMTSPQPRMMTMFNSPARPVPVVDTNSGPFMGIAPQVANPNLNTSTSTPNTTPTTQGNPPVTGRTTPKTPAVNLSQVTYQLVHKPTDPLLRSFYILYQSRQISSSQFYGVLTAMAKGPNSLAHQMAVRLASEILRPESFEFLSSETTSETDSTAKNIALQGLQSYTHLANLGVLSSVLADGDTTSKLHALEALEAILTNLSSSPVRSAKPLLDPFVQILEALKQNSQSPDLQARADQTLASLSRILSTIS